MSEEDLKSPYLAFASLREHINNCPIGWHNGEPIRMRSASNEDITRWFEKLHSYVALPTRPLKHPVKYGRDHSERITLGDMGSKIADAIDKVTDPDSALQFKAVRELIDREFTFGTWGHQIGHLDISLHHDIASLLVAVYRAGRSWPLPRVEPEPEHQITTGKVIGLELSERRRNLGVGLGSKSNPAVTLTVKLDSDGETTVTVYYIVDDVEAGKQLLGQDVEVVLRRK